MRLRRFLHEPAPQGLAGSFAFAFVMGFGYAILDVVIAHSVWGSVLLWAAIGISWAVINRSFVVWPRIKRAAQSSMPEQLRPAIRRRLLPRDLTLETWVCLVVLAYVAAVLIGFFVQTP